MVLYFAGLKLVGCSLSMAEPIETEDPSATASPGYSVLRKCHKRAYELLSKALQIDESGRGKWPCSTVVLAWDESGYHRLTLSLPDTETLYHHCSLRL